jgi:hypothetical protein
MTSPVVTADGHSYERSSIQRWLSTHNKAPLTGSTLGSKVLIRNHALRSLIADWKEKQVNGVVANIQRASEPASPSKQSSMIHTADQLKQLRCLIKLSSDQDTDQDMLDNMIQSYITHTATIKQIMAFMHELSPTNFQVASCALQRFSKKYDTKVSLAFSLQNRCCFCSAGGINWIVRMMNVHGIKGPNATKHCLDASYNLLQSGEKVQASDLKVGTSIAALWKTGTSQKYPGKIISINTNTYEIKFNDGDVRSNVPISDIFDGAKNQDNFVAAGGLTSVLKLTNMWASSDAKIAIKTCCILNRLAFENSTNVFSNCAKIGNANGIQCIVASMQLHLSNVEAVTAATLALWNISCWNPNKTIIVECGVVSILQTAMELHHSSSEVARRCCGLLRNLGRLRSQNQRMIQEGGIEVITRAMECHGKSNKVISILSCRALLNFFSSGTEGIEMFVALNGLSRLLEIKASFAECDAVQTHVSEIIALIQTDSNQSAVSKQNDGICCAQTRNGSRCKKRTRKGSQFCWQHE